MIKEEEKRLIENLYADGLTYKEIGERLGLSGPCVYSRLHKKYYKPVSKKSKVSEQHDLVLSQKDIDELKRIENHKRKLDEIEAESKKLQAKSNYYYDKNAQIAQGKHYTAFGYGTKANARQIQKKP